MNILHFVTDEKFIDGAIELFNSIECCENKYVTQGSHHLKLIKHKEVKYVDEKWICENCISNSNFDLIILHNFFSLKYNLTHQLNHKIKVLWLAWGFDLYNIEWPLIKPIKLKSQVHKALPLSYIYRNTIFRIKEFLINLKDNNLPSRNEFKKSISRIDFFSGIIPIEYDLINRNKYFNARPISFNYTNKHSIICEENIFKAVPKKNKIIQIGHSSNRYLNHFEVLKKLKKLQVNKDDITLFVPLNYGDMIYKKDVLKYGEKIFGTKFKALLNFMEREKYYEMLMRVNSAIYNMDRQSALGNILTGLWNGTKIFLPLKSILYNYFIKMGITVFAIETQMSKSELLEPLTETITFKNREIIANCFQYEIIRDKLIDSLQLISKH